jgi:glutathione S-transferase
MSTQTGIVLHHLEDSRSQRILWLLVCTKYQLTYSTPSDLVFINLGGAQSPVYHQSEHSLPPLHDVQNSNQSLQHYKRDKKTRLAPKELLEVHPLGKSPVITDDGVTIAESGAIVEYLLEKYDTTRRFSPSETPIIAGDKRIDNPKLTNLYYTHFAEGSLMPYLVNIVIFKVVPQQMPWFLRWLLKPIFNKITEKVVIPNVYKAAKLVSPPPPLWFSLQNRGTNRAFAG